MLRAAVLFFLIGIVAMLFGLGNVAGISIEVGKTLLIVFLALAALSVLASFLLGKKP